jgi:hypothetical protein
MDLQLTADDPIFLDSAMRLISQSLEAASVDVVASNLEDVAPDLSYMPLAEVLEFRQGNGAQYRRYMEHLRLLIIDSASKSNDERQATLCDRNAEVLEMAEDLRRIIRSWWRRPVVTMGVAIVGAAWMAEQSPDLSGALSLFSDNAGLPGFELGMHGIYSYLFKTRWSLLQ